MKFARRLLLVPVLAAGASALVTLSALTGRATLAAEPTAARAPKAPPSGNATGTATAPVSNLRDTGLYLNGSGDQIAPDNLEYVPQYPLWSDGAGKRRWLNLPPGTYIDATRPDAWEFPPGTRLWKEFSQDGRRIETRLIERRADKSWTYATYVWNGDGSDAVLAPARGVSVESPGAPDGRYVVPSRADCLACHEGAAVPVLGVSAVQLSRNPESHQAFKPKDFSLMDMRDLVERGMLRHLPSSWLARPPQIAATSPIEQKALGYLHGNCGHCHNHNGAPAAVRLVLGQTAETPEESRQRVLASAVNARSRFRPPGMSGEVVVIAPGRPEASVMDWRMRSRHPLGQMPPVGTRAPDTEGIALIQRWISTELQPRKELTQ